MKQFKGAFGQYKGSTIGLKLTLSHIVLGLIVVTVMALTLYFSGYFNARSNATKDLQEYAQQIAAWHELSETPQPDAVRLAHYGTLTNSLVFIATSEYSSMYAAYGEDGQSASFRYHEIGHEEDRELVSRVLMGESLSTIRNSNFYGRELILAGAPIYARDGSVYAALILTQPLNYFHESLRIYLFLLLLSILLVLILTPVLSLLFARKLVLPILKMTRAASRMSDGDYSVRVQNRRKDELGVLAEALNTLCERTDFAMSRMREDKIRLQAVISGVQEGLLMVNPKLDILYCNCPLLCMLELPNRDVFSHDSSAVNDLKELVQQALQSGNPESTTLTTPSGRRIRAAVQPLARRQDELPGAVCLLRDVSESEQLEQLRRDYVANVSHELRTPLTGIRGMVEPLIDGCMETEAEKQSCYRVIYDETLRLDKLVQEMLDMSRMQSGKVDSEPEKLDAIGILKAAHARMLRTAEQAGVLLRYETDACSLPCLGNEGRMLQVLIIFLDNAIAFTPPGGAVTLFAHSSADSITLGVRDTGVGIEQKDLPYVWERFYKVDKSRRHSTGTGLGLAIAKLAVEQMQGSIDCESDPGHGSEFRFTLRRI